MKKLTLFASVIFLGSSVFGQLQNKNGVNILPEKGEYALGINAVPILNYIGNIFNGNTNNQFAGQSKFVNFFSGQSIYGKYFLADNKAIRANFRVASSDFNNSNLVFDVNGSLPSDKVEDKFSRSQTTIQLGGGLEFRRGSSRLQGYYGAEAMLGFSSGVKTTYEYGNEFTALTPSAESTDWSTAGGIFGSSPSADRIVEANGSNTFMAGLRPFVGVEYFFATKMSIGMEFGWGLMYSTSNEVLTTRESFSLAKGEIVLDEEKTSNGSSSFNLDTDNFNGSINLMFHF